MSTSTRWNIYQQESLKPYAREQSIFDQFVVTDDRSFYDGTKTFKIKDSDSITTPIPTFFQSENEGRLFGLQPLLVAQTDMMIYDLPRIQGFVPTMDDPMSRNHNKQTNGHGIRRRLRDTYEFGTQGSGVDMNTAFDPPDIKRPEKRRKEDLETKFQNMFRRVLIKEHYGNSDKALNEAMEVLWQELARRKYDVEAIASQIARDTKQDLLRERFPEKSSEEMRQLMQIVDEDPKRSMEDVISEYSSRIENPFEQSMKELKEPFEQSRKQLEEPMLSVRRQKVIKLPKQEQQQQGGQEDAEQMAEWNRRWAIMTRLIRVEDEESKMWIQREYYNLKDKDERSRSREGALFSKAEGDKVQPPSGFKMGALSQLINVLWEKEDNVSIAEKRFVDTYVRELSKNLAETLSGDLKENVDDTEFLLREDLDDYLSFIRNRDLVKSDFDQFQDLETLFRLITRLQNPKEAVMEYVDARREKKKVPLKT
jgi:hypothetical protein